MSKFEKVKKYYDNGLWDAIRVKNAVVKGWITDEECKEILNAETEEMPQ